ncbi:MAG: SPASM domain-containing protein, partial [Bacteroidales bacterium]|nr:SPASM domain-containing protein [Bacteroidales bacterium]
FTLFHPARGGDSEAEKVRLSPQQVKEISLKKLNIEEETQYPYSVSHDAIDDESNTYHKNRTNNEHSTDRKSMNPEAMKCMAGKGSYLIGWDGKMAPCGLMQEPFTKPFKTGFQNAWKELVDKIPEIEAPEECQTCKYWPYCTVCPAKLQAETGSFKKLSPYICEMAKMKQELFFEQTKSNKCVR